MNKKRVRLILATIVTFAMILGCLVVPGPTVSEAASKKLKVSSPKTVAVNCSITIKTNVKATFKSSNKKIATVSSKGVVKGKKAGKVKITVTSKSNKKQKKTVTITVKNQLVITAPKNSKATLYVGESTKIKTNLSSKFKSSKTSVATVSSSGKVVAKKAGTAKITVTSKKNKKLKKTVTITVKDKPEPTTESTTTEQPTTADIKPDPGPTTEATTAQATTEEPTTEKPTTEEPTTEEPTTEEPTLVGITAKYRGDKVPNDTDLINKFGMELKEIYSNGSEKTIEPNYENYDKISYALSEKVEKNGKNYAEYNVSYGDFSTQMEVELIDVGDIAYPIQLMATYEGETIKKGTTPSVDDIATTVTCSNYSTADADSSKLRLVLYYDYGIEGTNDYEYKVIYDYTFSDENGNEIYVCRWRTIDVLYE